MWYYVEISRDGKILLVASPKFGEFGLTETGAPYLWTTYAGALDDSRWHHLKLDGDIVAVHRTYKS